MRRRPPTRPPRLPRLLAAAALLAPLLPLALPLPSAHASPAQEPYAWSAAFAAPPRAGQTVELTVTLDARVRLGPHELRLETPDWVRVEGDPWRVDVPPGGRATHAWRVTPQREGFWQAGLSVDPQQGGAYAQPVDPARGRQAVPGCCVLAYSGTDAAATGWLPPHAAMPEPRATVDLDVRALDARTARLAVTLTPEAPWMRHAILAVQFLTGNDSERLAPGDAPRRFTHDFPLAPGNATTLTAAYGVRARFDPPANATPDEAPATAGLSLGCANLEVAREGDDVRIVRRWTCEASATRPGLRIPAPPPLLVTGVLAALAATLRRSPTPTRSRRPRTRPPRRGPREHARTRRTRLFRPLAPPWRPCAPLAVWPDQAGPTAPRPQRRAETLKQGSLFAAAMAGEPAPNPSNPRVKIQTTAGDIVVELFEKEAPLSTKNFLEYVKSGHYEGTVFHRVIKGFMIQGGGYDAGGKQKSTRGPIKREINYPTLKHWNGALCMARTAVPDSATAQFYICHGPQPGLDREYAVFGITREGISVVEKIATTPTDRSDKPKTDVVITKAQVL